MVTRAPASTAAPSLRTRSRSKVDSLSAEPTSPSANYAGRPFTEDSSPHFGCQSGAQLRNRSVMQHTPPCDHRNPPTRYRVARAADRPAGGAAHARRVRQITRRNARPDTAAGRVRQAVRRGRAGRGRPGWSERSGDDGLGGGLLADRAAARPQRGERGGRERAHADRDAALVDVEGALVDVELAVVAGGGGAE